VESAAGPAEERKKRKRLKKKRKKREGKEKVEIETWSERASKRRKTKTPFRGRHWQLPSLQIVVSLN